MAGLSIAPLLAGLVVVFGAAGCAAPADDSPSEDSSQDPLRHFEDATGQRPEVGLVSMPGSLCTGTLIGARTVITAAHCFEFGSNITAMSAAPIGKFVVEKNGTHIEFPFHRERADATILDFKFDIALIQLDAPVAADLATPAVIAAAWPREGRLTVFGYGRFGEDCKSSDAAGHVKRMTTVPLSNARATSCPSDSGGPYFAGTTNQIVATVKGPTLNQGWLPEYLTDAVKYRDWIMKHRAEAELGQLSID